MSLEIGNFIDDLVQANPTGGDDSKQGDDHLRLIKTVLKQTFPSASKAFRFPSAALVAISTVSPVFPTDQNKLFPVNAAGGAVAVNLPDPTTGATVHEDGFAIAVIKTDSSANAVTITPSGTQTITGAANLVLSQQFDFAWLMWDKLDARWYAQAPSRGASEVIAGLVERATDAEAAAGSDTTRFITAAHLHESRVDVASATTTNIGAAASNFVRITGTVTITGLGTAAAGVWRDVVFDNVLTLTHHATNLILPAGGSNIVTAANDRCKARSLGGGAWIVLNYTKASGVANVVAAATTPHLLTVIAEDRQSSGVAAAGIGLTTTRTINTLAFNRSAIASLASNRITLPAGTWFFKWWAPIGGSINGFTHQSYLFNQSDSTVVARGSSGHIDTGTQTDAVNFVSVGSAVVTIASSKNFEIRHDSNIGDGTFPTQGTPASLGTEVYTRVEVWSVP